MSKSTNERSTAAALKAAVEHLAATEAAHGETLERLAGIDRHTTHAQETVSGLRRRVAEGDETVTPDDLARAEGDLRHLQIRRTGISADADTTAAALDTARVEHGITQTRHWIDHLSFDSEYTQPNEKALEHLAAQVVELARPFYEEAERYNAEFAELHASLSKTNIFNERTGTGDRTAPVKLTSRDHAPGIVIDGRQYKPANTWMMLKWITDAITKAMKVESFSPELVARREAAEAEEAERGRARQKVEAERLQALRDIRDIERAATISN